MKTIEVVFVIILTTLFLLTVTPNLNSSQKKAEKTYLVKLEQDDGFRNFATTNYGCYNESNTGINNYIRQYLSNDYVYVFCINDKISNLPNTDVYVDTLFLAGNITNIDYKTLRLYIWSK